MKPIRLAAFAVVIIAPLILAGCLALIAGAGAGAAGVAWVKGELSKTYSHDLSVVHAAAQRGLTSLGMAPSGSHDDLTGTLKTTTSAGSEVTVSMKSKVANTTRVSVRIGTFGDRDLSQRIIDAIDENLPAT